MKKYYTTFSIVPMLGIGHYKERLSNENYDVEIHNIIILCLKISIYKQL